MPGFDPLVLSGFLTIPEEPGPTEGEPLDDQDTTTPAGASDDTTLTMASRRADHAEPRRSR